MKISTIIPYYNQEIKYIKKHLEMCLGNIFLPYEIILVNDGSKIDLEPMLKELIHPQTKLILAIIKQDISWNQGGACNLGTWLSQGNALSFEGVDNMPHPQYYKIANDYLINGYDVVRQSYSCYPRHISPGIFVCRKEVVTDLFGYDEDFSGHYGFDDIFLQDKMNRKYKTIKLPEEMNLWSEDVGNNGLDKNQDFNQKIYDQKVKDNTFKKSILRFDFEVIRL